MTPYNEYMRTKAQDMLDNGCVHETGIECGGAMCKKINDRDRPNLRSRLENIEEAFGKREQKQLLMATANLEATDRMKLVEDKSGDE